MTKVIQQIGKMSMVTMVVVIMATAAAIVTGSIPYTLTENTYAKSPAAANTDDLKVKQCVQEEIDGSPPGSLCGPRERSSSGDEDDSDEIFDDRLEGISVPLPPPS
jgi:hypothetical protein